MRTAILAAFSRTSVMTLVATVFVFPALAQDWPTYRAGAGRSGASASEIPLQLDPIWTHELAAPSPAWPAPARGSYWQNLSSIEPRVVDDRADHPVIAGGAVYLGSSADDHVRCLDASTGELRWAFPTGGPVRFAPLVHDGRVYFGSDDGLVYCVDAEVGEEIWSHRVGPESDRIVGNGRLISPWPIRTGLVTDGESVFTTAGLFPTQGVYASSLSLESGEPSWERKLAFSPQGYLLLAADLLVIPTGRATPISLSAADGSDGPAIAGLGGTYAVVEGDRVVSGRGNDGTLTGASASTGQRMVQFPGKHLAVTGERSYLLGRGKLVCVDRTTGEADPSKSVVWAIDCEDDGALAVSAAQVFVGGQSRVRRFDARSGAELEPLPVRGEALGLAIADGKLVVTTSEGRAHGFGTAAGEAVTYHSPGPGLGRVLGAQDESAELVAELDSLSGFALVVAGDDDALATAESLAYVSDLQVMFATHDANVARRARDRFRESGIYGKRVAVVGLDGLSLPFADSLFNLVVADQGMGLPNREIERVAAPGRGCIVIGGQSRFRPPLDRAGSWTSQFANLANTANSGDAYTTGRLALQWFGGPGPERMIDRHMRGPPPLAVGGRLFIVGEHRLIGIDAFNGTELWDTALPESQRYAMPYDAAYIGAREDALFAAVDDRLWKIDAASGRVLARRQLPDEIREGHHIGYVGIEGDDLFLSATLPTAHRTEPGRSLADSSYRSNRPVVTARAFAAIDEPSGDLRWTRRSGAIVHPTITVTPSSVCYVESRADAAVGHETGRMTLGELLKEDAWLVSLDRTTGDLEWELPIDLPQARNILYLQYADDRLIVTACEDAENNDAYYHIRVLAAADGAEIWRSEHGNRKPGQLYHGEQVHHPVVLGELLVAEPYIYDIATGDLVNPDGDPNEWAITRPGHSCGTMSGSGDCLFFRAGNPTVLDLSSGVAPEDRFKSLSPSRVGCWINILPVDGMVLIPESSSSCVCHYSLQTSMGFRPER